MVVCKFNLGTLSMGNFILVNFSSGNPSKGSYFRYLYSLRLNLHRVVISFPCAFIAWLNFHSITLYRVPLSQLFIYSQVKFIQGNHSLTLVDFTPTKGNPTRVVISTQVIFI